MFRRPFIFYCSKRNNYDRALTYQAAYWKPNWFPQVEDNLFENYETSSSSSSSSSSAAPPFTLLSYNILAQRFLTPKKFVHLGKTRHGNCRYSVDRILDKNYRLSLIAEQIALVEPDIVLLQEVAESLVVPADDDSNRGKTIQQRHHSLRSFEALHFPNTTKEGNDQVKYLDDKNKNQKQKLDLDGIAMLWNPQRFELKEVETIKFNPHFRWTCTGAEASTRCLPTNNICSLAVFHDRKLDDNNGQGSSNKNKNEPEVDIFGNPVMETNNNNSSLNQKQQQQEQENRTSSTKNQKKLIVAGVHLDYRKGEDYQIRQLELVFETIRRRYGFDRTCPMCPENAERDTAVIIMGDFNQDGCADVAFEKFVKEEAAFALPEFTRVEFKSLQSEEKVAEHNLVKKKKQNDRSMQSETYFGKDQSHRSGGSGCCNVVMPIPLMGDADAKNHPRYSRPDDSVSNDDTTNITAASLVMKYPFASTLMMAYSTGMWVDHCMYTASSLNCVQHTGLPTSLEEFPILSDSHPSDHCPIAVKMEWK